ncbi:MAG: alpha/beta hydrolase, partial [Chitinispirillia bacterium]
MTTIISLSCKPLVNMMAFFPDDTNWPDSFPNSVEEVKIRASKKILLHCLLLKNNSTNAILYLQANAGHIADRLSTLQTLNSYGQNVLGVGYRGYGKSTGRPSEEGIYQDAEICLNYLINDLNIPEERITVIGRSIGTTAAIHISQNKGLKGLILITPLFNAEMHAKTHNMGFISFLAKNIF